MNAAELLADLERHDVIVTAVDGKLRVDAPLGVIAPELREHLLAHKRAILDALRAGASEGSPADVMSAGSLTHAAEQGVTAPHDREGLKIPLDGMAEWLAERGLQVVGGDPDLYGNPWRPVLYVGFSDV